MGLPIEMETELEKDAPSVYFVFEVDLPDGTMVRYCRNDGGGIATPWGPATPKVTQWGTLRFTIGGFRGDIPGVSNQISIDDANSEWQSIVGAFGKQAMWYSPARIKAISLTPGVGSVGLFSGVLESWTKPERKKYDLAVRINDLWLKGKVNKLPFRVEEFPSLDQKLLGGLLRQVWGEHDSKGTGHFGAVPLLEIETAVHEYFVSHGWVKQVTNLFVNPVTGLKATSFTLAKIERGGKYFSIVKDIVPAPATGDHLTADVMGLVDEDGELIENPAYLLEAILANFGFGTGYQRGSLVSGAGAAPLNHASFVAAAEYFEAKGFKASRVFSESVAVDELISEFCIDFGMRAFWDQDGLLNIKPRTHLLTPGARTWIRWDRDSIGSPSFPDAGVDGYLSRALAKYCFQEELNDYVRTVEVENMLIREGLKVSDEFELRSSHSALL